jgi:signal transduction histidine kinase
MHAALRSFWYEPSAADAPRRVWRDWALVALLLALSVVEVIVRPDLPFRWLSFGAALIGIPTLLWRRTHPFSAVLVTFGAAIAMDIPWVIEGGEPPGLYTMGFVLIVGYALFRWAAGREAVIGLGVMLVPATLALTLDDTTVLSEAIGGFGIFFATIAIGLAVRYRTRARVKEVDAIRAGEREELARDLHDTVAHHISAIAIRAQAGLAVAPTDPAAALDALRVIETEASRTLDEMRTIVRTLREGDEAELKPLPQIADVPDLAGSTPGGPPVHVLLDGDPTGVPATVATAAYRLAQESVTNARRHARRATRIDVVVRTGADSVSVEVTDDGDVTYGRPDPGFGIVGMTERAERLGGTLAAGPRAGRGWAVTAVLPLHGASA